MPALFRFFRPGYDELPFPLPGCRLVYFLKSHLFNSSGCRMVYFLKSYLFNISGFRQGSVLTGGGRAFF
jgi:hypothetical protein